MEGFYALFNAAVIFGVVESQGIKGSWANGARKPKILNLKFRQSMLLAFLLSVLFLIGPFYKLEFILKTVFKVPKR